MIIVKLWGGLGNQMFQYAAARRLADVNSAHLKIDAGWFENGAERGARRFFELGVFDIRADFASREEVRRLRGHDFRRMPRLVKRVLHGCGYRGPRSRVMEKHYHFDPDILTLEGDLYLDGYWQSEKYFADAAEAIRADYRIVPEPDPANRRLVDRIRGCRSVSIHVRRGDYVTSREVSEFHGSASLSYYAESLDKIAEYVPDPHLFIFSDDPLWVKENMRPDFPTTYVDHNGPERGYEDLRLMSSCKHHIIANSSFSWWGAWLNPDPDKIVIAPGKWFNRQEFDVSDLLPESWMKI